MAEGETVIVLLMMLCCVWQEDTNTKDTQTQQQVERIIDGRNAILGKKKTELEENRSELKAANRGRVDRRVKKITRADNGKILFPSRESEKQYIQEIKTKLDDLESTIDKIESAELIPFEPLGLPTEVGQVGTIRREYTKTLQVLGQVSALVEVGTFVDRPKVISPTQVIKQSVFQTKNVVIEGIDTTKTVTPSAFSSDGVLFVVSGTKTYENLLGGTKTVFVLKPIESKVLDAVKDKLLENN